MSAITPAILLLAVLPLNLRPAATRGTSAERRVRNALIAGGSDAEAEWDWIDRRNRYLLLRSLLRAWERAPEALRPALRRRLKEAVRREPDLLHRDWLLILLGELDADGAEAVGKRLKDWWREQRIRRTEGGVR